MERIRLALQDRYAIDREIGRGAAAVVYLAEDRKHHRLVAIKVLRAELAAAVGADRFIREIDTVAQFTHPHILALFDSGEADGLPYFVMPYISGETLKDRIQREQQLPLADALEITRHVSSALGYAHSLGIVHRDIKPGNILLSGGHAVVADFGVAGAISAAIDGDAERSWELFGTPLYMSPEQFTGSARLDRRSDLYSLGCVLYEMLAGSPPFTGNTPDMLRLQHLTEPPPSLRGSNRDIPPEVDEIVHRLLAKVPADRFLTAQQLEDGLPQVSRPSPRRGYPAPTLAAAGPRRRWMVAAAVVALAAVTGVVYAGMRNPEPIPGHYAVLTTEGVLGGQDSRYVEAAAEVLGGWRDLSVAQDIQIIDMVEKLGPPKDLKDLDRLAQKLAAERVIRLETRAGGDSLVFSMALYAAGKRDEALATETFRCPVGGRECEDAVGRATRRMLLRGTGYADDRPPSTSTFKAYEAFARGMRAYADWNLAPAESLLSGAVEDDPGFASAHLNLAEVRWWLGRPALEWRNEAAAALAVSDRLLPAEGIHARALMALADRKLLEACAHFDALIARDSLDFAAWFGRGECLWRDHVVTRDSRSPSGWRYRSNMQSAIGSFRRALALAPGIHRAFGPRAYERAAGLYFTDEYQFRPGYIGESRDSMAFAAWPDLAADTLVFVPWPFRQALDFAPHTRAANQGRALLRNRSEVAEITAEWVRNFPGSAQAHLARAQALESLREGGQESGWREVLEQAEAAGRMATDPILQIAAAVAQLRIRLRSADYAGVKRMADSLLATVRSSDTSVVRQLASVAALTGRIETAVQLTSEGARDFPRQSHDGQRFVLPTPLSEAAFALLVYSSFGVPEDSVKSLERRVDELASGFVGPAQLTSVRAMLLERPATLAFSTLGLRPAHRSAQPRLRLILEQLAVARGDRAGALRRLDELDRQAAPWRQSSVNLDVVQVSATLRLAAGDTVGAIRDATRSLGSFAGYGRYLLDSDIEGSLPQMATLLRLMILRADLAAADKDMETARRWAKAVVTLWASSDPVLQPFVARMQALLDTAPAKQD